MVDLLRQLVNIIGGAITFINYSSHLFIKKHVKNLEVSL